MAPISQRQPFLIWCGADNADLSDNIILLNMPLSHEIMKPSTALELHREDIRRIVADNDAKNPRVFGSASRGEDTSESDLDILIDPIDGKTTLFSLVRIKREIERVLGVRADVLTPQSISERYRNVVLQEAQAV